MSNEFLIYLIVGIIVFGLFCKCVINTNEVNLMQIMEQGGMPPIMEQGGMPPMKLENFKLENFGTQPLAYTHFEGVDHARGCGSGRGVCPDVPEAHAMCHTLAKDNCRIPTTQLNDCWLYNYRKCAHGCGAGNGKVGNLNKCDCHSYASDACRSRDDPAEACYASVHQKCMASRGMAADPDRGRVQGCSF